MRRLGSPLRDVRTAGILVGVLAVVVYTNSLWNQFAYDDMRIIVGNEAIQSIETLPGALIAPYWPTDFGQELGLWRPVTTASFGVLHVVGNGSPVVFHAANVVGHAAVSVLVVLLCAALMPLPAALVAGMVFAVHPVHVEAVSNAIGLAEILSAAAILIACLLHLRAPLRSGWGHALAGSALYAVAFGAKESGATLPGLLFLLDAARRSLGVAELRAYVRDRWRLYVSMALVAAALLAGRQAVLGSIARPFAPLGADLLEEIPRIWTLGEVWTHYVRLWVFPMDLYSDYSPNVIPLSIGWNAENVTGVVVAIGIMTAALFAWRRGQMSAGTSSARAAALGVLWFIIALSPTSNVLFLSGVLLAERTLYLPTVGLALASGWLVVRFARERPRAAVVFVCLAIGLASVRTWTRTPAWRNNMAVFDALLRDAPHSGRAQWVLGDQFLGAGQVSQALLSYRLAINILGGHYVLMTDIAQRLTEIERYEAAERLLHMAYRERPTYAIAPSLMTWVRAQYGDAAGTERYARESLALYEADATRHHLLAWSLATQGRWEEAARARARAEEFRQRVRFWHPWMYWAYVRRHEGDTLGMRAALDSAWTSLATGRGRQAMDSARVADFGLPPLLALEPVPAADSVNR